MRQSHAANPTTDPNPDSSLPSALDARILSADTGVRSDQDGREIEQPEMEFWFDFGSTYSYPAAMQIEQVAAARQVTVAWRAFLLGPIFETQGWRDSPFNIYPAKGHYMWRDLERLCHETKLEFQRPSQFPRNGLLAARIACAFESEPWVGEFIRRIFTANFALDLDISDTSVVGTCLELLNLDPGSIIDTATSPAAKLKLRERTSDAQTRGVFGAPSFISDGELFWGNERMQHALEWATQGS